MKSYMNELGIKKYSFGQMIPTDTILETTFSEVKSTYDGIIRRENNETLIELPLEKNDIVYGLGQNVHGINKRGHIYEAFCSDDPNHTPDKKSLYGAHNFFIIAGESSTGWYIDFAGKITYDIGFTYREKLVITLSGSDFDLYEITGTPSEIVNQFRKLIGLSYVPPKWAFGYQQCRWSYETDERVREIAKGFEENDIPIDAIYLDIDYMERYKDFTVDEERFPNFETFVKELKSEDIKLVPIIDAGVKIEDGYDVYEDGVKNDFFVRDEAGQPFVAAVWPGKVHFPDVLNAPTRQWFGAYYHRFLEMGIEGFWNDMNEPAIFYSEKGLNEGIAFVKSQEGKNLDIGTFFALKDSIMNLSNAEKDYKSMYHKMNIDGEETVVNHYDVHNLYGYNITRAAAEGFESYDANRRFFLLTRASHIGMAKHSGIWTGDNHSWWEHIKLNIQMMPSLSMAGFLYAGADTGGFGHHSSGELLSRWMQFSLFTPLLRNHSAMGTRQQEPWQFDSEVTNHIRNLIRMRYALVPYLYSEYMKANLNQSLLFAPLGFTYLDERSKGVEDQLLFGDELMLAPIYESNARGRHVYLPEEMVKINLSQYESIGEQGFEWLSKGDHYIPQEVDELYAYLRPNRLLVLTEPKNRVSQLNYKQLTVIGFVKDTATYTLYDDDGITQSFKEGVSTQTVFTVTKSDQGFDINVDTNVHPIGDVTFYLIDESGKTHVIKQSGSKMV
ncbi:MAG: alpha-glucosidase [Clostridiales bacterium 38-18]|nr:MAG: alpha-glucosidase [Clostridiales bacterium 38-18]